MASDEHTKAFDDIVLDHGTVTLPAAQVERLRGLAGAAYERGRVAGRGRWLRLLGLVLNDREPASAGLANNEWSAWYRRMTDLVDKLDGDGESMSFTEMAALLGKPLAPPERKTTFAPGDLVALRSGGPLMVVEAVEDTMVCCCYYDDRRAHGETSGHVRGHYGISLLRRVKAAELKPHLRAFAVTLGGE